MENVFHTYDFRIGFGKRFGAFAIDIVFIVLINLIVFSLMNAGGFLPDLNKYEEIIVDSVEVSEDITERISEKFSKYVDEKEVEEYSQRIYQKLTSIFSQEFNNIGFIHILDPNNKILEENIDKSFMLVIEELEYFSEESIPESEMESLKSDIFTLIDNINLKSFIKDFIKTAFILIFVFGIMSLLYWIVEAVTGSSPGKMVLGLKIFHDTGESGDIPLYVKRTLIKTSASILSIIGFTFGVYYFTSISGILSLVLGIGFLFTLSERRQALHDRILKTAVFSRDTIQALRQYEETNEYHVYSE